MWLDDCVHYEVAKAMLVAELLEEQEGEKQSS